MLSAIFDLLYLLTFSCTGSMLPLINNEPSMYVKDSYGVYYSHFTSISLGTIVRKI